MHSLETCRRVAWLGVWRDCGRCRDLGNLGADAIRLACLFLSFRDGLALDAAVSLPINEPTHNCHENRKLSGHFGTLVGLECPRLL